MDFQTALTEHAHSLPPSLHRRQVRHLLSLPDSDPHKQRGLLLMETRAAAHLGIDQANEIDWTEGAVNGSAVTAGSATPINWPTIIKFLVSIAPLILAALGC